MSSVMLLAGVLLPGVAGAADASDSVRARSCGTVVALYPHSEEGATVRIGRTVNISCRKARKVVKKCIRRYRVPGWRVVGYSKLVSGKKVIWFRSTDEAPRCIV